MGIRRPPKGERPALWCMNEKKREEFRETVSLLLGARWVESNRWFEKYDEATGAFTYYGETGLELDSEAINCQRRREMEAILKAKEAAWENQRQAVGKSFYTGLGMKVIRPEHLTISEAIV